MKDDQEGGNEQCWVCHKGPFGGPLFFLMDPSTRCHDFLVKIV